MHKPLKLYKNNTCYGKNLKEKNIFKHFLKIAQFSFTGTTVNGIPGVDGRNVWKTPPSDFDGRGAVAVRCPRLY